MATPTQDLLAFNWVNSSADAVLAAAFVHETFLRMHKCLFRRFGGIRKNPSHYIHMSGRCSTRPSYF